MKRIQKLERILNAICGVLGVEHYGSAKAAIGALQQENQRLKEEFDDWIKHKAFLDESLNECYEEIDKLKKELNLVTNVGSSWFCVGD